MPDPALERVRCEGLRLLPGRAVHRLGPAAMPGRDVPPEWAVLPWREALPPTPPPGSPTGFACVGEDDCCPDQKKCVGGCIYNQVCCPEERPQCGQCGDVCVNGTWQCSAAKPCGEAMDRACPMTSVARGFRSRPVPRASI